MNTNGRGDKEIWLGMAVVTPSRDSEQQRQGLIGEYGFVACLSKDICDCVTLVCTELIAGGAIVVGFEYLLRTSDYEEELTDYHMELIEKLEIYPVQFRDIHWFASEGPSERA